MKYRIKIVTYQNGRKEYYSQVKSRWIGWIGLTYGGRDDYGSAFDTRQQALQVIDKHFEGNNRKQTIEFEYINKTK